MHRSRDPVLENGGRHRRGPVTRVVKRSTNCHPRLENHVGDYRSYSDKLKDPKWQQKRLRVLEKAGFRCGRCHVETKMLHVHHAYYEKGVEPWEYPMKVSIAYVTTATKTINSFSPLSSVKSGRSASRVPNNSLDMRWASSPNRTDGEATSFFASRSSGYRRCFVRSPRNRCNAQFMTQSRMDLPFTRWRSSRLSTHPRPRRNKSKGLAPSASDPELFVFSGVYHAYPGCAPTRLAKVAYCLLANSIYTQGPAWACLDCEPDGRKSMTSSSTSNSSTPEKKMPWPRKILRALPS